MKQRSYKYGTRIKQEKEGYGDNTKKRQNKHKRILKAKRKEDGIKQKGFRKQYKRKIE